MISSSVNGVVIIEISSGRNGEEREITNCFLSFELARSVYELSLLFCLDSWLYSYSEAANGFMEILNGLEKDS
ncbi:hypothetical protein V6N13_078226 [Hibiscus sabdariffa]|uniref:Uncharacterized protein n=1 Tax=Hibiscus sabdariffa TaxID=183260 RepID=A0ABR2RN88_9ROSI